MSKNTLYHLIQVAIDPSAEITGADSISKKTHSLGKNYFMFELPVKNKLNIGVYKILNHHLSVYEGPIGALDLKSQYHYTANFVDELGYEFRLHVYYDANDDMVARPFFSRKIDNNNYENVFCDETEESFKTLADISIHTLISHLRAIQKQKISDLQAEYRKIEKTADLYYKQLPQGKKQYTLLLESMIDNIDSMLECGLSNNAWRAERNFLQSLVESVDLIQPQQNTSTGKSGKLNIQPDSNKKKIELPKLKNNAKAVVIKPKPLSEVVQHLSLRFEQAKLKGNNDRLELLTDIYADLKETELGLVCNAINGSLAEIKKLAAIKKEIEINAKNILMFDYKSIDNCKMFHHVLASEDNILFALLVNKAELLDVLLANNILGIHYKNFNLNTVNYASMADYFFKKGNSQAIIACLSILVKHGALLTDIDQTNGLPYVVNLLLDTNHPLYQVLNDNAAITLNNLVFYKKINQMLRVLCLQENYSAENKDILLHLIEKNKAVIESLQITQLVGKQVIINTQQLFLDPVMVLGKEIIEQLEVDSELFALKRILNQKVKLLMEKLPRDKRETFLQSIPDVMNTLNKALGAITSLDHWPSFAEIKEGVVKRQLTEISLVNLYYELIPLQNKIKSQKNPVRKDKNTEKQLLSQIQELHAVLNDSFEFTWSVIKFENYISNIANILQGILEIPQDEVQIVLEKACLLTRDFSVTLVNPGEIVEKPARVLSAKDVTLYMNILREICGNIVSSPFNAMSQIDELIHSLESEKLTSEYLQNTETKLVVYNSNYDSSTLFSNSLIQARNIKVTNQNITIQPGQELNMIF